MLCSRMIARQSPPFAAPLIPCSDPLGHHLSRLNLRISSRLSFHDLSHCFFRKPVLFKRVRTAPVWLQASRFSTLNFALLSACKFFRIRSYAKSARNPFRIRSYEKLPGVGVSHISTQSNQQLTASFFAWRARLSF